MQVILISFFIIICCQELETNNSLRNSLFCISSPRILSWPRIILGFLKWRYLGWSTLLWIITTSFIYLINLRWWYKRPNILVIQKCRGSILLLLLYVILSRGHIQRHILLLLIYSWLEGSRWWLRCWSSSCNSFNLFYL